MSDMEEFRKKLSQQDNGLIEKFNNINLKDSQEITSTKAIKLLFDNLHLNLGYPLDLTLQIYECFSDIEFCVEELIQKILWKFFISMNEFMFHHKINSLCYRFEKTVEDLNNSPFCSQNLRLVITKPVALDPIYGVSPDEDTFIIKGTGFPDSSRFCYDRICLFGRFADKIFANDIFVDIDYKEVSRNHFIIISGVQGYYISDISLGGSICRKLNDNESAEITKNSLIRVGKESIAKPELGKPIILRVERIKLNADNSVLVELDAIGKTCFGTKLRVCLLKNDSEVFIGRSPGNNCILSDNKVSRKHFKIIRANEKIFIQGVGEAVSGTYIFLKNYQQFIHGGPSEFQKIENNTTYASDKLLFNFNLE